LGINLIVGITAGPHHFLSFNRSIRWQWLVAGADLFKKKVLLVGGRWLIWREKKILLAGWLTNQLNRTICTLLVQSRNHRPCVVKLGFDSFLFNRFMIKLHFSFLQDFYRCS